MLTVNTYLKNTKKVSAWQCRRVKKESYEVYGQLGEIEAIRCNNIVNYDVALHLENSKEPNTIGESRVSFEFQQGMWKGFIDDTIERASYISNPAYQFSPQWSLQEKDIICDEKTKAQPKQKIEQILDELLSMNKNELNGCSLASFEFFIQLFETRLMNSNQLDLNFSSSKLLFDFVLTSPDRESEINGFIKRRFLKDLNVKEILANDSQAIIDMQEAKLPNTGKYSVILKDEALDTIYDYFIAQADATALYFDYGSFVQGKSVFQSVEMNNRSFSLSSDPTIEGAMGSGYCDELGFPLEKVELIKDGIFRDYAINGKLSALLKKKRTSAFSSCVVALGETSENDFIEDGVLELHRFSTLSPSGITGAFSGEIRLGYLHKDGKKIAIKGGSLSGLSVEAFSKAIFSKEKTRRENYVGPSAIYFESLTIAGN